MLGHLLGLLLDHLLDIARPRLHGGRQFILLARHRRALPGSVAFSATFLRCLALAESLLQNPLAELLYCATSPPQLRRLARRPVRTFPDICGHLRTSADNYRQLRTRSSSASIFPVRTCPEMSVFVRNSLLARPEHLSYNTIARSPTSAQTNSGPSR